MKRLILFLSLYLPLTFIYALSESVSFIAVGDMGTGNEDQYAVARAIEAVCAEKVCDFALGLGDNIYPSGVDSSDDAAFQSKFEQPYAKLDFTFYMSLGNHDDSPKFPLSGLDDFKGKYQVDYHYRDDRQSSKWFMPARYYHFVAPVASDVPLIDLFALDSNPLGGGKMHWDQLPWRESYLSQEKNWLQQALNHSTAPWKIAFAHHPYISNGKHGNAGEYDGLKGSGTDWKTLLNETLCGQVDVYFSGHDHNLQWLAPVEACGKTQFIVSGAGGKTHPLMDTERNNAWWQAANVLGFFRIHIEGDQLTGEAYTVDPYTGNWLLAYTRTVTRQ